MDITPWLVGHSVPLVEMLDGREARAIRQRRLLSEGAPVLVCFTLNMAGPVKVHPLSEETFLAGMREIRSRLELAQLAVRREEMLRIYEDIRQYASGPHRVNGCAYRFTVS